MDSEQQTEAALVAEIKPQRELKKPPLLFTQTQQIIARIEELLDGSLLTYWNSPSGSICQNDVVGFYEIRYCVPITARSS